MEKINIVFLGTGQAVPTEKRNHSSILLQYEDENILVDCGEGTQRQFRKAKLNPCKLTRILITHWHGDHILGLPGLLQTLALNGYNRTLHVYMPRGTIHYFHNIMRMFVYKDTIKLEIHEIDEGKVFDKGKFYIQAAKMKHDTPCLAYSFIEKDKTRIDKAKMKKLKIKPGPELKNIKNGESIKINGKTIKAKDITYFEKGRKITFIMDTVINDGAAELAKNSDLLVCESTYSEQEKDLAAEYKHLTARQAAEIAKKSKSQRLILTHISQRYDYKEKILLQEARKVFKNVLVAEDLMRFEL